MKGRRWIKGRVWYRAEYKMASDICAYIALPLVALFLMNLWAWSNDVLFTILYGLLLSSAAVAIVLSIVDKHEQKLEKQS